MGYMMTRHLQCDDMGLARRLGKIAETAAVAPDPDCHDGGDEFVRAQAENKRCQEEVRLLTGTALGVKGHDMAQYSEF